MPKPDLAKAELAGYLGDFNVMYRHHSAYEDTIIFPSFEAMGTREDLTELAATVAAEEKKVLGHKGFDDFVNQIAHVEKKLGIYELSSSTPKIV